MHFKEKLNKKQLENRNLNKLRKKMEVQILTDLECKKLKEKVNKEKITSLREFITTKKCVRKQSEIKKNVLTSSRQNIKKKVEIGIKRLDQKQISILEARFKSLLVDSTVDLRMKLNERLKNLKLH